MREYVLSLDQKLIESFIQEAGYPQDDFAIFIVVEDGFTPEPYLKVLYLKKPPIGADAAEYYFAFRPANASRNTLHCEYYPNFDGKFAVKEAPYIITQYRGFQDWLKILRPYS